MPASPGCSVRSRSSNCLLRVVLRHDPVLDVGPVEARRRSAARRRAAAGSRSRRGWRWSPWRSARSAARRASARAASTAPGSRAGSRGPTATRSAPRRWRTARSGRARAAAASARSRSASGREVEQVELAARGTPPRPPGARRGPGVELRNPARTPSARQRVDLVLHQRDQRRDDDADAVAHAAPGSGSTATCRRRSASAPARRRRRRRGR